MHLYTVQKSERDLYTAPMHAAPRSLTAQQAMAIWEDMLGSVQINYSWKINKFSRAPRPVAKRSVHCEWEMGICMKKQGDWPTAWTQFNVASVRTVVQRVVHPHVHAVW